MAKSKLVKANEKSQKKLLEHLKKLRTLLSAVIPKSRTHLLADTLQKTEKPQQTQKNGWKKSMKSEVKEQDKSLKAINKTKNVFSFCEVIMRENATADT